MTKEQIIREQIGLLRKIQHLVLIRDEALQTGTASDALIEDATRLVEKLDPAAAELYARLVVKNRIFLSPLSHGNCSACGMKIPTSTIQHVLGADRFSVCQNCGRILYVPDVKVTGLRPDRADTKFPLSRFSAPGLMAADLKASTREAAIAELGGLLAREGGIADVDKVVAAALERERILSTAVGSGLAFPHLRGAEEGVMTFAIGISRKGIDWDGKTVNLVVFTAFPIVASPFYLKLLAAFATTFGEGGKLPFVLMAEDGKTLWKELNKAMRPAMRGL